MKKITQFLLVIWGGIGVICLLTLFTPSLLWAENLIVTALNERGCKYHMFSLDDPDDVFIAWIIMFVAVVSVGVLSMLALGVCSVLFDWHDDDDDEEDPADGNPKDEDEN